MLSNFERFVALRYLWGAQGREEGRSFLRFVTYAAVGGVALGVAALLLSLAIVRGFRHEITEKILGFGAHVQVRSYVQDKPLGNAASLQRRLEDVRGVEDVAPRVEDLVLLRRSERAIEGIVLVGTRRPPSYLEGRIVEGTFRLRSSGRSPPSLVVGAGMARRLGLAVGDTVTAFSLRNEDEDPPEAILPRPRVKQFVVEGIFETSLMTIDDTYAFSGLSSVRRLVGMRKDAVTRFDITSREVTEADSIARQVESEFGFPVSARTIYQIQPFSSLFAWVDLQQSIIPLVIGVIVVVAAFNIIGTLLMMIVEKTREIGVLQSLGASQGGLMRLFLTVGLLIGGVGAAIGSAIAIGLAYLQQQFSIIPLPADAYYMTTAPIQLSPIDYLVVNALTLLLCGLAAYIPARVAARIEPVRAIRFQ